MALTNTHTHYGTVTKTFHWLTALLIFTVIPLGVIAHDMAHAPGLTSDPDAVARVALLFSLHKTVGVTIFFIALLRILWALGQPKPALINADKPAEAFLAQMVHWLLYGSLVLVPLTGWIHHAATTGFAPIWWPFGQSLPFVPKDPAVAERFAFYHMLFERVLLVSFLLHLAGALKHHFWDKDATLRRMIGRPDLPTMTKRKEGRVPPLAATVIFALVVTIGLLRPMDTEAQSVAALTQVSSDWNRTEGTLALTVTQFGSPVEGTFNDWTTAITFDPDAPGDVKGTVEVVVSIPSLTLGSVTDQAMGPDFFDAQQFPTATFQGDIIAVDEAFEARGTLTLKDQTQPLSFPFTLDLDGTTATMQAALTLSRLDFNIGTSMPDEGSLAFAVALDISLTATRN